MADENTIEKLKSELSQKTLVAQHYLSLNNQFKERIVQLESELSTSTVDLINEVKQLKSVIEHMKKDRENENNEFERKLAAQSNSFIILERDHSKLKEEYSELIETHETFKKNAASKEARLIVEKETLNQFASQRKILQSELEKLKQEHTSHEKEWDAEKTRMNREHAKTIRDLTNGHQQALDRAESKKYSDDELSYGLKRTLAENQQFSQDLVVVKREADRFFSEAKNLRNELNEIKRLKEMETERCVMLTKKVNSLKTILARVHEDVEKMVNDRNSNKQTPINNQSSPETKEENVESFPKIANSSTSIINTGGKNTQNKMNYGKLQKKLSVIEKELLHHLKLSSVRPLHQVETQDFSSVFEEVIQRLLISLGREPILFDNDLNSEAKSNVSQKPTIVKKSVSRPNLPISPLPPVSRQNVRQFNVETQTDERIETLESKKLAQIKGNVRKWGERISHT
eukprot:TRINITY_DN2492_c0_g1_i1.p1 TRINITY_DN2492_c0_g1~~TRINITY_DN2492_c0_g1_i1.p1  ORF type:complete len:459 (+),score=133.38 TRINITY_DN2492_c0_g1_i1:69-1445(+)